MAHRHALKAKTPHTDDTPDRLVTDDELTQLGFGDRSTRWRWVQDKTFPAPIQLSSGLKRWRWSAIARWLESLEANPVQSRRYHRVWDRTRKPDTSESR